MNQLPELKKKCPQNKLTSFIFNNNFPLHQTLTILHLLTGQTMSRYSYEKSVEIVKIS